MQEWKCRSQYLGKRHSIKCKSNALTLMEYNVCLITRQHYTFLFTNMYSYTLQFRWLRAYFRICSYKIYCNALLVQWGSTFLCRFTFHELLTMYEIDDFKAIEMLSSTEELFNNISQMCVFMLVLFCHQHI